MFAAKAPPTARATKSQTSERARPRPSSASVVPAIVEQHHAAPPDAIGQPPPGPRAQELRRGVDGEQQTQARRARAELLRVEREHGHHDPEADQVDDHDAEEHRER